MQIIYTRRRLKKSKAQQKAEWLAKLNARLEKRREKEANRKRPKPKREVTFDDISPELREKLGITEDNFKSTII